MQDRIKEMAEEAGLSIGYDGNVYAGGDAVIDGIPFEAFERAMQAVARECAKLAESESDCWYHSDGATAASAVERRIVEAFGLATPPGDG